MIIIGLTGGIASGKSTAARKLGELGARVIDADQLGHRAYEPGTEAYRNVVGAFGDDILAPDGSIDRKVLGSKVFGKPEQLDRLTGIVWPEIRRLAELEFAKIREADPDALVVLEAAVLFEAGWEDLVDEVWVVLVDTETAIERAVSRGGLDSDGARSRIDAQLSNDERKARSDRVLDNTANEAALDLLLDDAWSALKERR